MSDPPRAAVSQDLDLAPRGLAPVDGPVTGVACSRPYSHAASRGSSESANGRVIGSRRTSVGSHVTANPKEDP